MADYPSSEPIRMEKLETAEDLFTLQKTNFYIVPENIRVLEDTILKRIGFLK